LKTAQRFEVFLQPFMTVAFLSLGSLLHILAYQSLAPLLAMLLFFIPGLLLLALPLLGGQAERQGFRSIFAMAWFVAGIASFYLHLLDDPTQLFSDASWFFGYSSQDGSLGSLDEIRNLSSGAAAIWLWNKIYNIFASLGFEKDRYLGILTNITALAFTGVLSVKMVRLIYGEDLSRIRRLILMFSTCGLFWLFAAIHVRDSFVLFGMTAMSFVWTWYLSAPRISKVPALIICSAFAFYFFRYLRTEFVFVPIAMLLSGAAAFLMFKEKRLSKQVKYALGLTALSTVCAVLVIFHDKISETLIYSYQSYVQGSINTSSQDSLGMQLIVQQPILLRLFLGSVYLFIFPIPVWHGFQFESAYFLFVSCNGVFFYFLLPLLALSVWILKSQPSHRTPVLIFHFFLALGFTLVVAGTSLEGRHFAPFYPSLFMAALLPDLTEPKYWQKYLKWLLLFLISMSLLHFAWLLLKLLQ